MLLDVKKWIHERNVSFPIAYQFDLSDLELDATHPFVSPISVKGEVRVKDDFAQLDVEVSFAFSVPCDRCATQIDRQYTYHFSHVLVETISNEEDTGDGYYVVLENGCVDLDALLREDILLELPTKFLCKEDCKGLCPICGKNLNERMCSCSVRQVDPRLEVLKQWIDPTE